MTVTIGRRELLVALGGAAVAWPRGVLAQATNRRTLIAWLWAASQSVADEYVRAGKLLPPFLKGMQEFGYKEGRDFDMVYRFAAGDYDRMPRLAAELAALNPNVFIAPATIQAVIVKKAIATTIPIVVPVLADPVGLGLVASEARPGGNLYREHVEAGGLISYGVDLNWCFHRAAYYVDRILRGTKPADLPVEFPTEIELVINLKTARALGLEISPMLLARADEVIE